MRNLSRLGGNIAPLALALIGATVVADSNNSEADPGSFGRMSRMIEKEREENGEYRAVWFGPLSSVQNPVRADVDSVLKSPFPGLDGNATVDPNQLNLAHELVRLTLEKKDLGDELDAQRAQIAGLMMEIDLLKQGCVDSTQEDGCPAGCVYDGYASVKNGCPEGYECATSVMHMVEKQGTTQEPRPYQWHD